MPRAPSIFQSLIRALLLLMFAAITFGGCGGADPTAPREVRAIDAAGTLPKAAAVNRDPDAPTRGLACDAQQGTLRLCGAATDNYKASYNEDPGAPERRTWLAVDELELDGRRYRIVRGQSLVQDTVRLREVDGTKELELVARIVDGGGSVRMRIGPQRGLWGPLLTLDETAQSKDAMPIIVRLEQVDRPETNVQLTYAHDSRIANAPRGSLERGGPGGRWKVGALPTATNVELGWE